MKVRMIYVFDDEHTDLLFLKLKEKKKNVSEVIRMLLNNYKKVKK